jgi:hypothetical protein
MPQMKPPSFIQPRRSPRVREAIPIRFAIASEEYRVEHEGTTMDRSFHGLKIRASVPLSRGETAVILSQGKVRGGVPTRVAWVRRREFGYDGAAGLEFLDSLPR